MLCPKSPRRAGGRVSTMKNTAASTTSTPYAARKTKIPRQGKRSSSCEPIRGARIGARPFTRASLDSILTRGRPPNRSRTIARATTPPAAAPAPCSTRNTISMSIPGASATPRLANTCMAVAMIKGRRRPTLSLHGPTTSCPRAKPRVVAVSVNWMRAVVTSRSASMIGNAGR